MIDKKITKEYFRSYGINHFLYDAICNRRPMISFDDSEALKLLKKEYILFTDTFFAMLDELKSVMNEEDYKDMISNYLGCSTGYSDELFFSRYATVLIMKGLFDSSDTAKHLEYRCGERADAFRLHYADGKILQLIDFLIDKREDNLAALTVPNTVELEFGLKKRDLVKAEILLSKINANLLPSKLQEVIECMNYVGDLECDINIRNVVGFKYSVFIDRNYPISPLVGMFINKNTGIFESDVLHGEYKFEVMDKVAATLIVKNNVPFLLTGNLQFLLQNNYSAWIRNNYCKMADESEIKEMLSPFEQKIPRQSKAVCIYQCETCKKEMIQGIATMILEDYSKQSPKGFSPLQSILIKGNIIHQLNGYPELYLAFSIPKDKLVENLYKEYEKIFNYVKGHYPDNHVLRQNTIFFDAILFSLAYCSFIVPKYLHNTEMMKDMLEKKLVCADKNKRFSWKMFNESYSEFEIFFYLFSSIFLKSNLHEDFVKLEYESDGNKNKRFEYSFIFTQWKVNVEVKALECAPELSDNYKLVNMQDGTRFYKKYFFSQPDDVVPCEIINNSIRLKSNIRQVGKNIKKINEKCKESTNEVNLGFLMINYGTSREEYISYLMNEKEGYLVKNPLDKIDALILFSMCMNTDLLMEEIRKQSHIFVFKNENRADERLLINLRLDNFVQNNEVSPYKYLFHEIYGEYIGINRDGIVTIQRSNITEEEIDKACSIMENQNKYSFDMGLLWDKS